MLILLVNILIYFKLLFNLNYFQLIGEHIDYSGYSVLPMALCVSTYLAIGRSNDKQLHFENASSKYK